MRTRIARCEQAGYRVVFGASTGNIVYAFWKALILSFLSAFFLIMPAYAQGVDLQARFMIDADHPKVGDPIRLTVEVIHPSGYQVFVPELPEQWGDFEVRDVALPQVTDNGDGTAMTRQDLTLALFAPGDYQTPPLNIQISDSQGTLFTATAASVMITVESVLVEGDDALRDLKPQAKLPRPVAWPLVAAALLLLSALSGGVFLFYRRHVQRRPVTDTRSPRQVALDELEAIGASSWGNTGERKLYYGAITDSLRRYIQQCYGIITMDRTTEELRRLIHESEMSDANAVAFNQLFVEADLVKFAEFSPSEDASARMLEQARSLVIRTAAELEAQPAVKGDA